MTLKRTQLIAARKAAGYSQESFAEAVGVGRSTVVRWEAGDVGPQPWLRPRIAAALGVTAREVGRLLEAGHAPPVPPQRDDEPVDLAFIESIREKMRQLLTIDAQFGGDEASGQAVRLFRSVHRRIGIAPCPDALRRDLHSTVGELAEIAGWLLYDADHQDAARGINQEALYYLRWAGDRSLEVLTLQNMSMQAEYLDRPSEALTIARSVLESGPVTPRVEALFLARSAHALAKRGQVACAHSTFEKAKSRYLDGPGSDDPPWAYWVNDLQFAWFEAMLHTARGDHARTAEVFAHAVASSPEDRVRGLYSRTAYLFESLVNAGDWRQAEALVPTLATQSREVGSRRTATILRNALRTVTSGVAPPNLRDGAEHLRGLLTPAS